MTWRPMRRADLAAVAALEARCHAPLPPEGEALFAERLALFPEGCLAATDGEGLAGYAVAHPWRTGNPPALGQMLGALPHDADCLHLHDIALAPRARGKGLVGAALLRLAAVARGHGLGAFSLVAVHGTGPLWQRHGFVAAGAAPASYGDGVIMRRLG
jgi:ribosomal protein S18 acetylase RimI-like enzyme